jgi:hypothetical protein
MRRSESRWLNYRWRLDPIRQKKAVGMAVKGKVEVRRWSKLGERMANESG